jgi:hypothetical protein
MPPFSERMGIPEKSIQLQSMDSALRIALWNSVQLYRQIVVDEYKYKDSSHESTVNYVIWEYCLILPSDEKPHDDDHGFGDRLNSFWTRVKSWFFSGSTEWHQIYHMIEMLYLIRSTDELWNRYETHLNTTLKEHNSAYRFNEGVFAPLTSKLEIAEVSKSANPSHELFAMVGLHIKKALRHLSAKPVPDYENSMKESISAVESLCTTLSLKAFGSAQPTLTPALQKVAKELFIHEKLESAYIDIFHYTSNHAGIRHGNKDGSHAEEGDARFMLVTCSAFCNFLIDRTIKRGKLPTS